MVKSVAGEVTRFEPRRCVRYGTPAGYIQFELQPMEGGTRFTFTQYFDPDFRHPEGTFAPGDKGAATPAGPDTPWRPGFMAGFHLNFRDFATFLQEDWPLERVRAESERRVVLANSGGRTEPDPEWAKLVDEYTAHVRHTFPRR
jgi:hypothetical protein